MPLPPTLRILRDGQLALPELPLTGPVELGRQRPGEPGPYCVRPAAGSTPTRVVIAPEKESNCSRQHVVLEPLPSGAVRVTNGSKIPLPCSGAAPLAPDTSVDLTSSFSLLIAGRTVAVSLGDSVDEHGVQGLDGKTLAPGTLLVPGRDLHTLPTLSPPQLNELIGWLQTTMGVLQSAVGSADFIAKAAEALVRIVGLSSGRVLLLEGETWKIAAVYGAAADAGDWQPSPRVLVRIREEKRTLWQQPQQATAPETGSLRWFQTAVASPLLDGDNNVIGALYGERRAGEAPQAPGSSKLVAMLVEVLASGVSTGLARQVHQLAAVTARVQLEQFFTPQLVRELERDPGLLDGRDAETTLLFCDIRGFSRISEQLGPARTVEWVRDVMTALSRCVLDQEGVLVDYIGDELMAMWGAPRAQPDQAARAAAAALAMLRALGPLNERWQAALGEPIDLGIGLNTGLVQVGNTGSAYKFKYGPLGNAVNLASRVQGLTKYLRCRLVATAATRQQLDQGFIARRVCRPRVVNIKEPVDLYEVELASTPERAAFFRASEGALEALEGGRLPRRRCRRGSCCWPIRGTARCCSCCPGRPISWYTPTPPSIPSGSRRGNEREVRPGRKTGRTSTYTSGLMRMA